MRRDVLQAVLQMHPLVRRRLLGRAHARSPLLRWPDRARRKAAAAVRADVGEVRLHAVGAERAFIGADPRIGCVWRQVAVAIFAVRSKLQRHLKASLRTLIIANRGRSANAAFPSISASLDLLQRQPRAFL